MAEFTPGAGAAAQGKVVLMVAGPAYLLVLTGPRIEMGPAIVEIRSAALQVARAAEFASA